MAVDKAGRGYSRLTKVWKHAPSRVTNEGRVSHDMAPRNLDPTPGPVGYCIAVFVSWMLIALGLGLVSTDPFGDGDFMGVLDTAALMLVMTLIWGTLAGIFALLTALPGVLVVHVVSLRFPQQWVHVLASAVVGVLAVYAVMTVMGEHPRDWDKLALGVGVCTAIGRAAVVPMVPAVRNRVGAGTGWWSRFSLR